MYHISGKIKFISDLLFNKPTAQTLIDLEHGQRGKKKTKEQKLEEVPQKVHLDEKGKVIILGDTFKKAFVDGAKRANLKIGRRSIAPDIEALCFPEDLPLNVKDYDYVHEHWGRIPPRTGQLAIIRRPAFKAGKEVPFKMLVADNVIEADQIKIAIETAGLLIGVGSWRPKFGRFQVTDWKVQAQ